MDGGGVVASGGDLGGVLEPRGAGVGGLVIGCTVVFNGRRVGRERDGGVDAAEIVIRGGGWGGLARLAGDSLTKG
ncbi:hypothetical protein SAMN04244553_1931 [Nocardia amikacinitolerans]|uniref:Uncharacterized protein n=1 Tax=Nocardia amikacinitolerans TaxID=756689 RepID=A0A285L5X3_9NOCA|nr:hypothetical protein [Nocardia amikacinitolerans]SNY80369.1 hypothetical protein SAMN04244553_1931 [Nocardia amikacinitolerans]